MSSVFVCCWRESIACVRSAVLARHYASCIFSLVYIVVVDVVGLINDKEVKIFMGCAVQIS